MEPTDGPKPSLEPDPLASEALELAAAEADALESDDRDLDVDAIDPDSRELAPGLVRPGGAGDGASRPSQATIESFALLGIEAHRVEVQVAIDSGYPMMTLVGLPDTAVRESRERIFAAFRASGIKLEPRRITVNLAPAEIRKEGSAFDLPIALALLAAHGRIRPGALEDVCAAGEVTLSGEVLPVRGALAIALAAARLGGRRLLLPRRNLPETSGLPGRIEGFDTLLQAAVALGMPYDGDPDPGFVARRPAREPPSSATLAADIDLVHIEGQRAGRRALEIAAAGGHNLLLIGPPGTGKTLLARALSGILPPMDDRESLEATLVYSIAGQLPEGTHRLLRRPFRAPHHTVSAAGLVGGGAFPRPGEVSLAHCGVLFLDEMPEFRGTVLNLLRQPLEEGWVRLVRAGRSVRFPCRFMLVAAMNPCLCGFLGHPVKPCRCTPHQVRAYQGRIGGPLLDRMDLHVEVPAMSSSEVASSMKARAESTAAVRARVAKAREIQQARFASVKEIHARRAVDAGLEAEDAPHAEGAGARIFCNAQMGLDQLEEHCPLGPGIRAFLERAVDTLSLSARAIHRSLRVARTIADLEGGGTIRREHVAEAIQYRWLDRQRSLG